MSNQHAVRSTLPYIQRALEDEFVQEQLRDAVTSAREAYLRIRKQRSEAVADKRLYRLARNAATAARNATSALQPAKPSPKSRGRNAVIVAGAMTATALLTIKLQRAQSESPENAAASQP
jgi:hypothetical protein